MNGLLQKFKFFKITNIPELFQDFWDPEKPLSITTNYWRIVNGFGSIIFRSLTFIS